MNNPGEDYLLSRTRSAKCGVVGYPNNIIFVWIFSNFSLRLLFSMKEVWLCTPCTHDIFS